MMKEHQVSLTLQAPVYTLNELSEETDRVWVVFHGYGQLARFFIKKFEGLDAGKNFIIAPQGLSKYYLTGFHGKVGASWMTKEDRLTDIENQYAYLDQVLKSFPEIEGKSIVYFGFSQGVSTMFRYAVHAKRPFRNMIIWAGSIPPELTRSNFSFLSGAEKVRYFTGNRDPFFKEGMKEEQRAAVESAMGIRPVITVFDGEHKVIPEIVKGL